MVRQNSFTIGLAVLTSYRIVTDGRTDSQTDIVHTTRYNESAMC